MNIKYTYVNNNSIPNGWYITYEHSLYSTYALSEKIGIPLKYLKVIIQKCNGVESITEYGKTSFFYFKTEEQVSDAVSMLKMIGCV